MPSASAAYFTNASVVSDSFVVFGGATRIVSEYDKLVITAMCVTAPSAGRLDVEVQNSPDYNSAETPTWETLRTFDSMDENGDYKTVTIENFHSDIRIRAKTSDSGATGCKLNVYIREKRIGAV